MLVKKNIITETTPMQKQGSEMADAIDVAAKKFNKKKHKQTKNANSKHYST